MTTLVERQTIMKAARAFMLTALLCLLAAGSAQAQTAEPGSSNPLTWTTANKVPGPIPGTIMPEQYASAVGRFVYIWAWPMMNLHNRVLIYDKVPEPGLLGGIVPVAPINQLAMLTNYIDPAERFVATPNQDVVYGGAFLSLDREPVVVQVPDFGKRFWVFQLADQRTDTFGRLGAMYSSRPGFYLLVGPNWKGAIPKGIQAVFHSTTIEGAVLPRVFMDDTPDDHEAIQPLIDQINVYPLSKFTGKMQTRDWSKLPKFPSPAAGAGEAKWVAPETFFTQLPKVLDEVPPLPGEEAIYGQARALVEAAQANAKIMETLNNTNGRGF
jgi:hypothetical protein